LIKHSADVVVASHLGLSRKMNVKAQDAELRGFRGLCVQGAIVGAGAVEGLVRLLRDAQADGQYAAAAALYNIAVACPAARPAILQAATPAPLIALLRVESWCACYPHCYLPKVKTASMRIRASKFGSLYHQCETHELMRRLSRGCRGIWETIMMMGHCVPQCAGIVVSLVRICWP
jgi:hypothetical protein